MEVKIVLFFDSVGVRPAPLPEVATREGTIRVRPGKLLTLPPP